MDQLAFALPELDEAPAQSLALWEILVPEADNERRFFGEAHHREWKSKVRRLTGGMTILATARGQWVDESDEGTVYKETMIPIRIRCSKATMESIARLTIQHYEQLAVMFYVVSAECRIMSRDS